MSIIGRVTAVLLLVLAAHAPAQARPSDTITILVMIDGFRPDYLDRGLTPNLAALAARGVRGALIPVFPSVTFPNHFTLLTGKTAEQHGIVGNEFEDPVLGVFGAANPPSVRDPRFWTGAKPLWASAEEQGIGTAHYFWPAIGVDANGKEPARYTRFDRAVATADEPEILLDWLDVPEAERPRFLTLYFYYVDSLGHRDAPNSPALNAEVAKVDGAIGNLVAGLGRRGLLERTNIVVVADHGMSEVQPGNHVYLDDLVEATKLHVVAGGAMALVAATPGVPIRAVEDKLAGRHGHMQCWPKAKVPARLHYSHNPRISPIVCAADPGWVVTTHAEDWPSKGPTGSHGYDPATPDMAAVFVAAGPGFRTGQRLAPVSNLEVYPLLARLIGVKPESTGHTGAPFDKVLTGR